MRGVLGVCLCGVRAMSDPRDIEKLLEARIRDMQELVFRAKTHEGRQAAYSQMASLCRQLTAETLLRLSREQVTP